MNVFLMHPERDFDPEAPLPRQSPDLIQDLDLDILFDAMARGDRFLREIAVAVLLRSLEDPEAILYRQNILEDCLRRPEAVRTMYRTACEALTAKVSGWYSIHASHPGSVLHGGVSIVRVFLPFLDRLRRIARDESEFFRSAGFARFFAMLRDELAEDYLEGVQAHLRELSFRGGILISARLGGGCESSDHTLRMDPSPNRGRIGRLLRPRTERCAFNVDPRDEGGVPGPGGSPGSGHQLHRRRRRQGGGSYRRLL